MTMTAFDVADLSDFSPLVERANGRLGEPHIECPPRRWAIADRPFHAAIRINRTIRRRRYVHWRNR